MRPTSILLRGVSFAALALIVPRAVAADVVFDTPSEDLIDWADPANWTPNGVPTLADDATVAAGLIRGAEVRDEQAVNSLVLDSGLNVHQGGQLTVTTGITANAGYVINDGVVIANLVNNTYLANSGAFTGDLTNNADGQTFNENLVDGSNSWAGNVLGNAGFIQNGSGTWTGDVLGNANQILNVQGANWIGSVGANDGDIENVSSLWTGDILSNAGQIRNLDGAIWDGDVLSNVGTIDSHDSTWDGNITNDGTVRMSGILTGSFTNNAGATLVAFDQLSVFGSIVANGGLISMENGTTDDALQVQSLSGSGDLLLDVDLASGRADQLIVLGDHSAATQVSFAYVGGGNRSIADISFLSIGGADTGSVILNGDLPEDGIVSYRLEQSGTDWIIAASVNDAPAHVAAALGVVDAALADAARPALNSRGALCDGNAWMRSLGGGAAGSNLPGAETGVVYGGLQLGHDASCLPIADGVTLGIGLTMGTLAGTIDEQFETGGPLTGQFVQGFAGLHADIVSGAFRALLQAQGAGTHYSVSDPDALLADATLLGFRGDVSGTASYALALGGVEIVPEVGLSASARSATSGDFGDVGTLRFVSGPAVAAHLGVTLSTDLPTTGDITLTPFISAKLHGDAFAPATTIIDGAGNAMDVGVAGLGSYVALALGADVVQVGAFDAGLRADLKLGPATRAASLEGHARVKF